MSKNFLFLLLFCLASVSVFAQFTIWSDNFNNSCSANCLATTWNGWSVQDNIGGTTGGAPNNWFVSCAEEGITPPGCGSSCVGDASLHIGANPGAGGDMGASYNETGITNATFRRVVSPTITTAGYTNITLEFDFIAYGSASCSDDRAQLHLSADGGTTWPVGFQYCLTSVCCGACNGYSQGQWTKYTLTLPAAFDNNTNIKIGFHWLNNGNGSGTDPSVAIDDIAVKSSNPLPVQLLDFSAKKESNTIKLKWATAQELNFSHFELMRAADGGNFTKVGRVNAKGNGNNSTTYYTFSDKPTEGQKFQYQLKMVDIDGRTQYSNTITAVLQMEDLVLRNIAHDAEYLTFYLTTPRSNAVQIEVIGIDGRIVSQVKDRKLIAGENYIMLKMSEVANAAYILKILSKEDDSPQKITKTFSWVH